MNSQDESGFEAPERSLAGLPRGLAPRPEVEERIVSELRVRGLLRGSKPSASKTRRWLAAAAALALFAAGIGAARLLPARAARPSGPRFALFLLRGDERLPENGPEEAARVAEYRAWARDLAGGGRFVSGEKLGDAAERLGGPPPGASLPQDEIRGYFVISASSLAEALAVARGCPHLRHGGQILVRPIADV